MKQQSVRTKLVLLVSALNVAILLSLGIWLYASMASTLKQKLEKNIENEIELIDNTVISYFQNILESVHLLSGFSIFENLTDNIFSYVQTSSPNDSIPMIVRSDYEKNIIHILEMFKKNLTYVYSTAVGAEQNGGFIMFPMKARNNHYDARQRGWYKNAIQNPNQVVCSEARQSTTKDSLITCAKTTQDKTGKINGVVTIDVGLNFLSNFIANTQGKDKSTIMLIDKAGNIIADSKDQNRLFQKLADLKLTGLAKYQDEKKINLSEEIRFTEKFSNIKSYISFYPSKFKDIQVFYLVITPMSEFTAEADIILKIIAVALVISIFIFVGVTYAAVSNILRPLHQVTHILEDIALGKGDLSENLPVERMDEFGSLSRAMQGTMKKLHEILFLVSTATKNIIHNIGEIKKFSGTMSQNSSEQAASLEEVAASVMQITDSLDQASHNLKRTEDTASLSSNMADETQRTVLEAVASMNKIAEKILVIQEIAGQTRLLSLNASIEAARAGDAGKGFSVVASEVSKLSDISSDAASQIDELAKNSVLVAHEAAEKLNTLIPEIKKTAGLAAEVTQGAENQIHAIHQINTAVQNVNEIVQVSASSSEDLAVEAKILFQEIKQLEEMVDGFRL